VRGNRRSSAGERRDRGVCTGQSLLGEHAVVYGRPAIAVPVGEVRACARVDDARDQPGVTVCATDIGRTIDVGSAPDDEPLAHTVRNVLAHVGVGLDQVRLRVTISSSIPVASGLGSGAAVAAAVVRAVASHLGHRLASSEVSALAYETEKLHHGTPSGIDNTVVSFERPVYFCRGEPIATFAVGAPFWLAIADTGVPSVTRAAVADVRAAWRRDRDRHEAIFDRIAGLVDAARGAIERGEAGVIGLLMSENQCLLRDLGVSSLELDSLIAAAKGAGALGAKLSGGGRGGNAIALVAPEGASDVRAALLAAGARNVIVTRVG